MTGFELVLQYALPIAAFVIGHWHGKNAAPAAPAAPPAPAVPANGLAGLLQALGLPAIPTTVGHGEIVQYLQQILAIALKLQSQLPAPPGMQPPWLVQPSQQPVAAPPAAR